MPIDDDEQFERYLKQFRPLPSKQMRFEGPAPSAWRYAAWAAIAALAIIAFLMLYPRGRQSDRPADNTPWAGVAYTVSSQPLTIQSADALLAHAPSFEAALDALTTPSLLTSFDGKQSAFAALSKDPNL